jgi:hypothetical protein
MKNSYAFLIRATCSAHNILLHLIMLTNSVEDKHHVTQFPPRGATLRLVQRNQQA